MSLVMTAVWYRGASSRQSAATSAVLPDPTGPPMPTRRGRTSGGKEPHLPPLRPGGMVLGAQLEQRRRRRWALGERRPSPSRPRRGQGVRQRGQPDGDGHGVGGIDGQEAGDRGSGPGQEGGPRQPGGILGGEACG